MTAQEILKLLNDHGIELSEQAGQIKVRVTRLPISDQHKNLIQTNKAMLLVHLKNDVAIPRNELPATPQKFFKEYLLPNGEILQLSKEEFENVVEVIRLLWRQENQDEINSKQRSAK